MRHPPNVFTDAAAATDEFTRDVGGGVHTRGELHRMGCSRHQIDSRLSAGRWQALGRAIILHNGELTREERWFAGVANCGPRAKLASFSAVEFGGLRDWERDEIHVIAPAGVPQPRVHRLPIILHRTTRPIVTVAGGRSQHPAAAVLLAAASFADPRPACGILAAAVQQRLVSASQLAATLVAAPRVRHRAVLRAAVDDIAMGAEALSEIDFAHLCRRHGLPEPVRQAIRPDSSGRRRYLDVEWTLPDGRRLVVEVDGAFHMTVRRWWDDQLRQNEVTIGGALVLRFPSVVVRTQELRVVRQLRSVMFPDIASRS